MKTLKKSLILITVLSMLFTVSCKDSSGADKNTDTCSVYPGFIAEFEPSHTAGDFQVAVNSLDLNYSSPGITITVNNPTDKVATFDSVFDIEMLHDGHWDSCKTEEPEYSQYENGILENSSSKSTYNFGNSFNIKEPGSYRFKTNIIHDALESRVPHELVIEFKVVYDSIIPSLNSFDISKGSALINIDWNNDSDGYVYVTNTFYVEALNDGKWVECERTDAEFPVAVFSVAPGETGEKHYAIDEMFELSYYGNYRVYIEYAVGVGEETQTRCALIEFFIPYEITITE